MSLLDKLNSWGANTQMGIRRCADNEALYIRLVKTVPSNESFDKLEEALNNKDLDKAFQCAHGLKGVLSSLELLPLYEVMSQITELLRNRLDKDYSNELALIKQRKEEFDNILKEYS